MMGQSTTNHEIKNAKKKIKRIQGVTFQTIMRKKSWGTEGEGTKVVGWMRGKGKGIMIQPFVGKKIIFFLNIGVGYRGVQTPQGEDGGWLAPIMEDSK